MRFQVISVRIMALQLAGHMQIDSMLPTTPFGLLVDIDSNHLPLASNSLKRSGEVPVVGVAEQDRKRWIGVSYW